MVSWRSWFALVLVGLALAAACSGKTDSPPGGKGGTAGRGAAGGAGRAGLAGASSNTGGSGGTLAEGGEGGVPSAGGSAGGLITGGASSGGTAGGLPIAGGAGFAGAGLAGSGGTGGTNSFPPFTWRCSLLAWGDGQCDCGCGEPDPDCKNGKLETCDVCDAVGSCSGGKCPGRIDEDDTTACEPVPTGWACALRNYEDGASCDCGCGAPDPDCEGDDARDACDTCALIGSCSVRECPGSIAEDDNTRCFIPPAWSCSSVDYGDGTCDCGCGVKDVDCPNLTAEVCEYCFSGCSFSSCPGTVKPDNNALCTNPPFSWHCAERFYNDGAVCHCGCGTIDPDCASTEGDACDRCNVEGSCSGQDCPGTIDPDNISSCLQPEPPEEWTCESFYYADGGGCDCGCGAFDPDCRGSTPAVCDNCWGCGQCPGRVDPTDITRCSPPPDGWTCDDSRYGEGFECDCGCGVLDPDCGDNHRDYCSTCPEGSCSRSDCRDIQQTNIAACDGGVPQGWTCPADYYGDSGCDCGCGAQDQDCASLSRAACEFCDSPGSCSEETAGCPGGINADDNRICDP